jgi:hypothetical protein
MNTFCSPVNLHRTLPRRCQDGGDTEIADETTVASTAGMDIESLCPANGMDAGKKDSKEECTDECSSDDGKR